MADLRSTIQHQIRQVFGTGEGEVPPEDPAGDAGLFGPDSVAWKVHGDLTTMLVGGVAALLLQMLHPGALAGVWDHSNFRQDMQGRLRRTARFMSGVTYAPRADALALIGRVRTIHDQVRGNLPDGTPYAANDPELLTWVHVAGAWCFLAAYVRHREPNLPLAEQDRYFDEWATVAMELGAVEVPRTRLAAEAYLRGMAPKLRSDERTREVNRALFSQPWRNRALASVGELIFQGARDLIPPWAAQMHGFSRSLTGGPGLWLGLRGLGAALRWALPNGPEQRARRRAVTL